MTDTPHFTLDATARWRLAYDPLQWIVQKRARTARIEHASNRDSGFRGVWFVGSEKRLLHALFQRKGINLTAVAQANIQALPPTFAQFIATHPRPDGPANRDVAGAS